MRSVERTPGFERQLSAAIDEHPRVADAFRGFSAAVSRFPESGLEVSRRPGYYQRPFHTGEASYLVIYTFDEKRVVCIGMRKVPSGPF